MSRLLASSTYLPQSIDERGLSYARWQVRAMIVKQGIIKHGLDDARVVLKEMLACSSTGNT